MIDSAKYLDQILDGRYKIVREIGKGASSAVFYALDMMTLSQDERSPKPVAIKLLDKDAGDYSINAKSFHTEINAVVNMPVNAHTVAVYDASFNEGEHYIVMEYVKGCTLRQYMNERGPLPFREIISISLQILHALSTAHEVGLVHRDVKPQNILLQKVPAGGMEGIEIPGGNDMPFVKLADFGIALLPDKDLLAMKDRGVGTLHYISPEQARGAAVDPRSDLYSLGVVMYEMATGHFPFDAENGTAIISKHQDEMPKHVCNINKDIPVGLDQIIYAAMRKQPDKRFKSALDMMNYLEALLRNPQTRFAKLMDRGDAPADPTVLERRTVSTGAAKPTRAPMSAKAKRITLLSALGVLLATAVTVGAVLLLPLLTAKTLSTPSLVSKQYSEELALGDYFTVGEVTGVYRDDVPAGTIVYQQPLPGEICESIKRGDPVRINLHVSLGPEMINIALPADKRTDFATAKSHLESLGNNIVAVLRENEERVDGVLPGAVLGLYDKNGNELPMDGTGKVAKSGAVITVLVNKQAERKELILDQNQTGSFNAAKAFLSSSTMLAPFGYDIATFTVADEYETASKHDASKEVGAVVGARLADGTLVRFDGSFLITEGEVYEMTLVINPPKQ